jgi:hypothetical protein
MPTPAHRASVPAIEGFRKHLLPLAVAGIVAAAEVTGCSSAPPPAAERSTEQSDSTGGNGSCNPGDTTFNVGASCTYTSTYGIMLYSIDITPPGTCSVVCSCTVTSSSTSQCPSGSYAKGNPIYCPTPVTGGSWSRPLDGGRFCGDAQDRSQCVTLCQAPVAPSSNGAMQCCQPRSEDAGDEDAADEADGGGSGGCSEGACGGGGGGSCGEEGEWCDEFNPCCAGSCDGEQCMSSF